MSQTTTDANEAEQENDLPNPYSPSTTEEFDTYLEELIEECIENGMDPSQLLSVMDHHESKLLELDRALAAQEGDDE